MIDSVREKGEYRIRHNTKLYQQPDNITTAMTKKKLIFCSYVVGWIIRDLPLKPLIPSLVGK